MNYLFLIVCLRSDLHPIAQMTEEDFSCVSNGKFNNWIYSEDGPKTKINESSFYFIKIYGELRGILPWVDNSNPPVLMFKFDSFKINKVFFWHFRDTSRLLGETQFKFFT